jgi:cell division GTPase FtsZ
MISEKRRVAIEYGFIGIGGAGGKLVEAFRFVGGYKSLAINISSQDLAKLKMDDNDDKIHMDLGLDGAGKEMEVGAAAVKRYAGELHDAISRKFKNTDYLICCVGGGGGTGSGGAKELINICKQYAQNVGVMLTLPKDTEGEKVRHNTAELLNDLYVMAEAKEISPLILVDNQKISDINADWNILSFWKKANAEVAMLFHQINLLCAEDSEVHPFDPADYRTIMKSGRCLVFGSLDIPSENLSESSISIYMRENLTSGLLARDFEESYMTSKVAGAILVGNEEILGEIPMEYLERAFGVLNRMIGDGTVHRGIYTNDAIALRVYTLIGNLVIPETRIKALAR